MCSFFWMKWDFKNKFYLNAKALGWEKKKLKVYFSSSSEVSFHPQFFLFIPNLIQASWADIYWSRIGFCVRCCWVARHHSWLIERESASCSAVSTSLRPKARLLCPWNSPGKNTGVGCHALLQGIFLSQGWKPRLLHCRQILYHLSHQGSLSSFFRSF